MDAVVDTTVSHGLGRRVAGPEDFVGMRALGLRVCGAAHGGICEARLPAPTRFNLAIVMHVKRHAMSLDRESG